MGKSNRYAFLYLVFGIVFLFGWQFIQNSIWPPPPKPKPTEPIAALAFLGGSLPVVAHKIDAPALVEAERQKAAADKEAERARIAREKNAANPPKPSELLAMGHTDKPFHVQVLLNTRGGSIQQVVLSNFQEASRLGLAVNNSDGSPKPLHLIPGVRFKRTEYMRDQKDEVVPVLSPGTLTLDPAQVEHPSFVMYHYERASDERPVDLLGNRIWRVVRDETADDVHTIAFETELGAPFFIRITKTFTLRRNDYHVGLTIAIVPWERPADFKPEPFRYQIDGPRAMPIEGEWYTSVYRQGIIGWPDSRGLEDPRPIWNMAGSDPYRGTDKRPIRFAGVMIQYFAAVLAVDNVQAEGQSRDILDWVRFTPEGLPITFGPKKVEQTFLNDITFRAVSKPLSITEPVTHSYVLYHGPVKVRLLKQLEGDKAVPEETVNRYRDDLRLNLLTDAPMPNWLGRFANFIFWTDIVIAFTNLIHSLLGLLTHIVPNLGLCIIIITICVRGILHPFSRRQMINAKIMQARQEKLAPELKKLTELYGNDFNKLNQEKMKLYKEHGINPSAMFGGCLLLLMQMPIFMGLYYALQESVFFRLESLFGSWWIPNLAAPDMLIWWTEHIPWISSPEDLGGMIYLGPYFNLLPLVSIGLMMYVQSKMMPKSEDPQIQMQQKTMKIMMILMLFFFYKVAAGLCIYFICSSVWGMIERKLLPKKIDLPEEKPSTGGGPKDKAESVAPKGWMGKKVAGWKEKWSKILEEAQKQQQIQREQRANPGTAPQNPGPTRKKKKR